MAYYDKFEHGERRFSGSRSQGGLGRDEQFRRERGERFRGAAVCYSYCSAAVTCTRSKA